MATVSLSSDIRLAVATPLFTPIESFDKKKFSPRSRDVTVLSSIMVILPIPGSARFLSISVPTGVALMRHTLADSNANCPSPPQRRSWRSYLFSLSDAILYM